MFFSCSCCLKCYSKMTVIIYFINFISIYSKTYRWVLTVPSTKYNIFLFFLGLNWTAHFLAQLEITFKSSVREVVAAAWSFATTTNKEVSSAKSRMSLFISFTISLIYIQGKGKYPKQNFEEHLY